MTGFLLDVNVLVALLWPSHTQHDRAGRWFASHRSRKWVTCPLTESGFVRIVSNPGFSRDAVTPREAATLLAANMAAADHLFWPVDLTLADAVGRAGARLVGHQQITDGYLLALAIKRGGVLATLDQSVVALTAPRSPERRAIEVIS